MKFPRGGDTDGNSHRADADGNLNVLNVERNSDGSWVNRNYANPDNQWDGDYRLLVCRYCLVFLPAFGRGVLLEEASNPSPEHLSAFLKEGFEEDILLRVEGFTVLGKPGQEFQKIKLAVGLEQQVLFCACCHATGQKHRFDQLERFSLEGLAQRILIPLGEY